MRRRPGRLAGVVVLVALAGGPSLLAGCGRQASDQAGAVPSAGSPAVDPSAPGTATTSTTVPVRRPLAGFPEVAVQVRTEAGTVAAWCALLADDDTSRARGLMGQIDLRGYDAMVFRHPQDSTGAYYMFQTLLPLSIAWFDAGGGYVSSADMSPCPATDPAACPRYRAAAAYRLAVEAPVGGLARLGIGPGAHLQLGAVGGCPT